MTQKWYEAEFVLSNGDKINIIHNVGDMIDVAFQNWIARTNNYTDRSFCEYINQKRWKGMGEYCALTIEEFKKIMKS